MITGARWEKIFSVVRWSRETYYENKFSSLPLTCFCSSYFVYLFIFSNNFFSFFFVHIQAVVLSTTGDWSSFRHSFDQQREMAKGSRRWRLRVQTSGYYWQRNQWECASITIITVPQLALPIEQFMEQIIVGNRSTTNLWDVFVGT